MTDLLIYLITIQYHFIQYRRTLIIFCREASGNDLPISRLQPAVSPDKALYFAHRILSAYKCLSNLSTHTLPTPKTRWTGRHSLHPITRKNHFICSINNNVFRRTSSAKWIPPVITDYNWLMSSVMFMTVKAKYRRIDGGDLTTVLLISNAYILTNDNLYIIHVAKVSFLLFKQPSLATTTTFRCISRSTQQQPWMNPPCQPWLSDHLYRHEQRTRACILQNTPSCILARTFHFQKAHRL